MTTKQPQRIPFLLGALFLAAMGLFSGAARADRPSVHGMVLFGKQKLYASHLPMFHAPHNYQFLFELRMNSTDPQTLQSFLLAQTAGEELFTIEPEVMDLTEVILSKRNQFRATLYRGHFERGGQALGPVVIQVVKRLYGDLLKNHTASALGEFLYFGEAGEYFAAHIIKGKSNFDQIVQMSGVGAGLGDDNFPVVMQSEKAVTLSSLPHAGDLLSVSGVSARIEKVIYSEVDELSH